MKCRIEKLPNGNVLVEVVLDARKPPLRVEANPAKVELFQALMAAASKAKVFKFEFDLEVT